MATAFGGDIAINITDDTAINGEIDGGQIYGVTQAIAAPANDIGINIKSMPRIGDGGTNTNDKVSVIWSGGSTLTNNANGRTIDLSTTLNASGNTTATNVYAVHAIYGGLLTVTMTGIVQGVGLTSFQNSYAVLGERVPRPAGLHRHPDRRPVRSGYHHHHRQCHHRRQLRCPASPSTSCVGHVRNPGQGELRPRGRGYDRHLSEADPKHEKPRCGT